MTDILSQEEKVRKPQRGLRQRLRVALRQAGFAGKMVTAHRRDGALIVRAPTLTELPFSEFDGHKVYLSRSC